jgi:hypothetical protein
MKETLSQIGAISIFLLVLYIIKKVDDHYFDKNNEDRIYKFEEGDEG